MNIKLAEALLRRKELTEKVAQLKTIKDKDLFEVRGKRTKVTDDIDDIIAQVPLLNAAQVTAEFDFYASKLRRLDAQIQQANWTTEIDADADIMTNWEVKPLERQKK